MSCPSIVSGTDKVGPRDLRGNANCIQRWYAATVRRDRRQAEGSSFVRIYHSLRAAAPDYVGPGFGLPSQRPEPSTLSAEPPSLMRGYSTPAQQRNQSGKPASNLRRKQVLASSARCPQPRAFFLNQRSKSRFSYRELHA